MNDLVSIIVPVYNSEKDIKRCINSIIIQDYKNLEVLLINDGSTDNSLKIIREYEKKYTFIKVINQKNIGFANTRNKGITLAKGKYIMFIDNDDYIEKNYVSEYVKEITKEDYDIVIGGYRRITETKRILKEVKLLDKPFSKYLVIAPWGKLYRKDFIVNNNLELLDYRLGEDIYFNINAYLSTNKIKIIDYIGYYWFYNTSSISNTDHKKICNTNDIIYLFDKIISLERYHNSASLNYYFIKTYIWYLLYAGKSSSPAVFIKKHKEINDWLLKNNIKKRTYFFSNVSKGDNLKNKLIVLLFRIIEKLHLVKIFSKIYCKGGIN